MLNKVFKFEPQNKPSGVKAAFYSTHMKKEAIYKPMVDSKDSPTWICPDCNEILETRLVNMLEHQIVCKNNAERDQKRLELHVKLQKQLSREESPFKPIWVEMSSEEKTQLVDIKLTWNISDGKTISPKESLEKYISFRENMMLKYG